ncbi:MAG: ABC transporter substrate-binding protein [Geminicoccaceae bacterium]
MTPVDGRAYRSAIFGLLVFTNSFFEVRADSERMLERAYVVGDRAGSDGPILLDPAMSMTSELNTILRDLLLPPLRVEADGSLQPAAAESWDILEDGLAYVFHLDRDARWSDGVPVTAEDFVHAWGRLRDPGFSPLVYPAFASTIRGFATDSVEPLGIAALDEHTLRVDLLEPFAIAPAEFGFGYFAPLPRHAAPEGLVHWSEWPQRPSNGSYRLVETGPDHVIVEANPYRKDRSPVGFEHVRHRWMEWSEASRGFLDGEIDVVMSLSARQRKWFVSSRIEPLRLTTEISFYALNSRHPRLADRRVRRALRLAVDREGLDEKINNGEGMPAHGMIPAGFGGYDPPAPEFSTAEAFAEARRLMREAGYGPDHLLELHLLSDGSVIHDQAMRLVADGWRTIFVDLSGEEPVGSMHALNERVYVGDYEIGRRRWVAGYASPRDFLQACEVLDPAACGYADPPPTSRWREGRVASWITRKPTICSCSPNAHSSNRTRWSRSSSLITKHSSRRPSISASH